jgi:sugar lactone lactonase YvrE
MRRPAEIFDDTPCTLGEGPLWHPDREQLFWFDILERRLYTRTAAGRRDWQFDQIVSAAGWVNASTLLIASETALFTFDLETGARAEVAALEADRPETRSNDGRADPAGGFWIGTMGKAAEKGAGAIYRYRGGELRRLYDGITVPNAICFAPDGRRAYFADTPEGRIMTVALDDAGWPQGEPEVFVDLDGQYLPDGAVCDAEGNLWNAQWGAGRVAAYAPDGRFLHAVEVGGRHSSCPAFGGPDLTDLYCTTAREHIEPGDLRPGDGRTYRIAGAARGLPEPRVRL